MKRFKIIPLTFLLTLLAISLTNTSVVLSGYETDPTGDADGIIGCDITQVNVDVDYNSPEDDEIILKITLAAALELNTSLTFNWFDYNFYVDTSLSTNSNTSLLTDDIYEYRAHLGRKHSNNSGVWTNTTSLICSRYYYTGDGQGKTMGTFYWNPNTENWEGSDPEIDFGEVIGNTIVWDVTGAIYREQPIGGGYLVQGVGTTAYGLVVRDRALESGWVDEFDNMCVYPSSTGTPTFPFPAPGLIASFAFLASVAIITTIIKKKR